VHQLEVDIASDTLSRLWDSQLADLLEDDEKQRRVSARDRADDEARRQRRRNAQTVDDLADWEQHLRTCHRHVSLRKQNHAEVVAQMHTAEFHQFLDDWRRHATDQRMASLVRETQAIDRARSYAAAHESNTAKAWPPPKTASAQHQWTPVDLTVDQEQCRQVHDFMTGRNMPQVCVVW
jgi:hypothetical protein